METLQEHTTSWAEVDPCSLDDDALQAAVFDQFRELSKAAAVRARYLDEWERRGTWALDRSRTAAARLSRETGCSSGTARAELARARALRTMPLTWEALAGGMSVDRVDVLVAARADEVAAVFARHECGLLETSTELVAFTDFLTAVKHWSNLAADETCERDAEKVRGKRFLRVRRCRDGSVELEARLDPLTGAAFCAELDRIKDDLFRADWAEAKARLGDQTCIDRLRRTHRHRSHDAFDTMCRRSAALPADARPARPLLTVLVGYETLAGRVCQLADGTALTPGQVAGLLGEADIERIVFEGKSRVIDVGRRTRAFPGALRRAIEVRDRHCTHPGCTVPAERCDVDHIVEWSSGGDTTQANGRLLCPAHNRQRPGRAAPPATGP